jgi:DNA-binding protein HU-beta
MAKQDVIKKVQEAMGGGATQDQIGKVLDATFIALQGLIKDQSCRIKDFGTFKVKERAARTGIELSTKKKIKIPARNAMTFKIAPSFKEELNPPKKKAKAKAKKKAPAKKKK